MKKLKQILGSLSDKYFVVLLFLIIIISYGQTLGMYVWEDDNALFFKLANIQGSAGYLGAGPLGEGAYKYTAAFYIPIYYFFKFNTVAYFVYTFIFYALTTFCIYKIYKEILGKSGGRIAGFLYACGFIASDGFIRLYNSIITSLSIFLISFLTLFYWKFYKTNRIHWYIFSLLMFLLATEFARARTHYLVAIIILFELIFLTFQKPLKSIFCSLIRLIPFGFIFYKYFVVGADSRTGQIGNLVHALQRGEFYQLYSFIGSLGNLIFPGWFFKILLSIQTGILKFTGGGHYAKYAMLLLSALVVVTLLKNNSKRILFIPLFIGLLTIWSIISSRVFVTPFLGIGETELLSIFAGGCVLILSVLIGFVLSGEKRKLFYFLFLWVIINISAYAVYNPLTAYVPINRYFAHSFFALVGVITILSTYSSKYKNLVAWIAILWGTGNLLSAVSYQHNILQNRSNPPRQFYSQLKEFVPTVKKGDILYFDVADNAQASFRAAFSVAQMPEETAIAWRYGIDRYDIRRMTKFDDLVKLVNEGLFTDINKNTVSLNKIYTFFYSADGLVDTSGDVNELFRTGGRKELAFAGEKAGEKDLTVSLDSSIKSVVPTRVELNISATALDPTQLSFPYIQNSRMVNNKVAQSDSLRKLAFDYKRSKENLYSKVFVEASSQWRDNVEKNSIDKDLETFWRPDRVFWSAEGAKITLDLKQVISIDKFVWINSLGSSTPTHYNIETSVDEEIWQAGKEVSVVKRIDNKEAEVVSFSPRLARFVRMTLSKTINSDSPGIAEVWVVPVTFTTLDIEGAENFLLEPFGYVPSLESYKNSLAELKYEGFVQIYWRNNKTNSWNTEAGKGVSVKYDDVQRSYQTVLPSGGTIIDSLKFVGTEIPGSVTIANISAKPLSFEDLLK